MEDFGIRKKITKERIDVMQAYIDGRCIEYIERRGDGKWRTVYEPGWNWGKYDYRVKDGKSPEMYCGYMDDELRLAMKSCKTARMFDLRNCAVRIDDVVRIDTEWDGENDNLVIYQKSVKDPLTAKYVSYEEREEMYKQLLKACNGED